MKNIPRFSAYFRREPTNQKYILYFAVFLYIFGTSVVVIIEPFLTLPCNQPIRDIAYQNVVYQPTPCGNVRYPALLFFTKTECLSGRHLLMAVFLGSLIGYERRTADRPAGIRAMALVSLGSSLFTINSIFGFLGGPMVRGFCTQLQAYCEGRYFYPPMLCFYLICLYICIQKIGLGLLDSVCSNSVWCWILGG